MVHLCVLNVFLRFDGYVCCTDDSGRWGRGGLFTALEMRSDEPSKQYELAGSMKGRLEFMNYELACSMKARLELTNYELASRMNCRLAFINDELAGSMTARLEPINNPI